MVDNNNEHKNAKAVNRNVVATISHSEYRDVLLNNKSLRHSVNRIQSRDYRVGNQQISIFLFWWGIFKTMDIINKALNYQS